MSTEVKWDKWIFVNYVPGAFGSFLTKAIEASPEVASSDKPGIFDQDNASHQNIMPWIENWHDGDEIDRWILLDVNQQRSYLDKNINWNLIDQYPNMARVHRLTVPKLNDHFRQFWPNSKFVMITVPDQYLDLVIDQMYKKTFKTWLWKLDKKRDALSKVITQIPRTKQLEHFRKICQDRIHAIHSNRSIDCFDFPINCFLDNDNFAKKMQELFDWLKITPGNTQDLYKEFANLHDFTRYDHAIHDN